MTVQAAHTILTKFIEDGHGDAAIFTDYVEEGGDVWGIYLKNTSDKFYDCGELSLFAEENPNTNIVLIKSHH